MHLHVKDRDDHDSILTSYQMVSFSYDLELCSEFQMAYRILNATVCMFAKSEVTSRMLRNIDGFLGTDTSSIASDIGEL